MSDLEEQLRDWRVLEYTASTAEDRLNALPASDSPEFAQLSRRASEERRIADDFSSAASCGGPSKTSAIAQTARWIETC